MMTESSGWSDKRSRAYWQNTAIASSSKGARLTIGKVRGARVALLATRCSGCGTVEVLVGGHVVGRVSLSASTTRNRQQVVLPAFATREGPLVIRVVTRAKRVLIDGVAVARS